MLCTSTLQQRSLNLAYASKKMELEDLTETNTSVAAHPSTSARPPIYTAHLTPSNPHSDAAHPSTSARPPIDTARPTTSVHPQNDEAHPTTSARPPIDTAHLTPSAHPQSDAAHLTTPAHPPENTAHPTSPSNPQSDEAHPTTSANSQSDEAHTTKEDTPPPNRYSRKRRTYGSISSIGLYLTEDDESTVDLSLPVKPSASAPTPVMDRPGDLTSYVVIAMLACLRDLSTLINLVKGYFGTGYLALPKAFMYAGLWFGAVTFPIIAVISVHCLHLLLQSSRELCKRHKFPKLNYEETVQVAFMAGPNLFKKLAIPFTVAVRLFLVVTQLGFCCAFYQFVVINIYQFVECKSGGTVMSYLAYSAIIIIPMMAVSCIRDLKTITYISVTSSVVQLFGVGIILYYCTVDLLSNAIQYDDLPLIGEIENIPLFFGISCFAFEGIGLTLLLENKMKRPDNFGGTFGILNLGMSLIMIVFFALAFFGYIHYGKETKDSITLNLPLDDTLAQMVMVCMIVAILLTFPLQLYVPVQVLLPFISGSDDTDLGIVLKEYFIRMVLVFSTFSLSAAIPNISVFVSFIGAVSSSALAFIFPPLIHLVTFHPNTGWRGKLVITKAVLIVLFGCVGSFTGTLTSLMAISDIIKSPSSSTAVECQNIA